MGTHQTVQNHYFVCAFWAVKGKCKNGDHCKWQHCKDAVYLPHNLHTYPERMIMNHLTGAILDHHNLIRGTAMLEQEDEVASVAHSVYSQSSQSFYRQQFQHQEPTESSRDTVHTAGPTPALAAPSPTTAFSPPPPTDTTPVDNNTPSGPLHLVLYSNTPPPIQPSPPSIQTSPPPAKPTTRWTTFPPATHHPKGNIKAPPPNITRDEQDPAASSSAQAPPKHIPPPVTQHSPTPVPKNGNSWMPTTDPAYAASPTPKLHPAHGGPPPAQSTPLHPGSPSQEEEPMDDQLSDLDEDDHGWSMDEPDPELQDVDFQHMYNIQFTRADSNTQHRFMQLKAVIIKALLKNTQSWVSYTFAPDRPLPPMVLYIAAYLAHTGFHYTQIRKAIAFEDGSGDVWIQLLFHIPTSSLPGAASTTCHFYHGTTQAGLYGILKLLQEYITMEEPTIPLPKPIIMASPGNYKKNIISPFQGFFALYHDDQGTIPANAASRQIVIDKFIPFGKNYLDIAVHGQCQGTKSKISTGGSWQAQLEVSRHSSLIASLGGHRACFHQHHAVSTDLCFKLWTRPPPNWSKGNPLNLA